MFCIKCDSNLISTFALSVLHARGSPVANDIAMYFHILWYMKDAVIHPMSGSSFEGYHDKD